MTAYLDYSAAGRGPRRFVVGHEGRYKVERRAEGSLPYGSVSWGAAKRAVGDAGPYGSVTRSAVRNPPGTASLCLPPLGKGAIKDGGADCHGRRAPSQ